LLIAVPVTLIIGLLVWRTTRKEEVVEAPKVQADPNVKIRELQAQFQTLRGKTLEILRLDRESSRFKAEVAGLKARWNQWRDEFDEAFKPVKTPDGGWPPEYQFYSKMRAEAGTQIQDLIKMGGL
jgi:hypothetical protein